MAAESGKAAVANGREVDTYPAGYCQKYVRDPCWRVPSLYGSAIEAWNGAAEKHPGDRTPPVGAPCYYRGGSYGHAVISTGGGNIRSTDTPTRENVGEVDVGWPERNWGYVYLGWTGDINGIDLPLGGKDEDDMPLSDDDLEKIAHRVNKVLGDWNAEGEPRDPGADNPEQGNARLAQIERVVRDIQKQVDKLVGK